jgi:hypothetical protein
MTSLVPINHEASAALIEQVVIRGDLSQLTPTERANYYGRVCESIGINPLTKPFDYLELKDDKGGKKLVLYAKRDCTDQLRNLQHVSVRIVAREQIGKLYIVTARASMPGGREDEATGAVALSEFKDNRETELKGERLANALMKAETKAKRRVTLSICGLGWLDESEVGDAEDAAFSGEETPSVPHNFEPKAIAAVAEREPGDEDDSAAPLTVASVRVAKTGKNGDRPWTLYIVKFSSGLEASTFSETVASAAKELAGTKTPVEIETEEDAKGGRKLVLVKAAGEDKLGDALDVTPVVKPLAIDLSKVYRITEVTTAVKKGAPCTVTTSGGHKLQSSDPKLSLLAVSAMQSGADVILSAQMAGDVLTLTGLEEMGS